MAPIFSSHGGLRPRRLWGSLIGVLFSLYFRGLRIALPAAALRPPSAGPGSRTRLARQFPLPAGGRHNGAFAASPAPSRAPLPAPSSRRGGVLRGNRPARARAPGLWLLGAGYRAERAPSKPNMACAGRAGVMHSGLRCGRPRPAEAPPRARCQGFPW